MAITVEEIMNRELFHLRPDESAQDALRYLVALAIGGAPVLDGEGAPIGMVSLRDLIEAPADAEIATRMSSPVATVRPGAPIAEAGRLLGETGFHRLVVVDRGAAVGLVSTLDVLRGLIGMPASHPASFPHFDAVTQLAWTDDIELSLDRVEAAPDGPGLVVLIRGGAGVRERPVWAEAASNTRTRLLDMLSLPQTESPALQYWLGRDGLRFRAASEPDGEVRTRIEGELRRAIAQAEGRVPDGLPV